MKSSSSLPALKLFFLPLFFLALPLLWAEPKTSSNVATLREIEGGLKVSRASRPLRAKEGDSLARGDQLETEPEGQVLIQFVSDETLVKLAGGTTLEIPAQGEAQIFLSGGRIWGKKTTRASPFLIQTPVMNAAIRGTEFFVKVMGLDLAFVLTKEGTVEVHFEGGTYEVGRMKVGFFEKGKGSRVSPIEQSILADWEASFEERKGGLR